MKVTLFRDMKAEEWYSMDRYANCLERELARIKDVEVKAFCVEPPITSSRLRMLWRMRVYPFLSRFGQGEVNHLLDHSYAHLLNYLDPKKTVVTCHDLIPLDHEKDPLVLNKFKDVVKNLVKARYIIVGSEITKMDLGSKLGIEGSRVEVVHLGVDPEFRPLTSLEAREIYREKFKLPRGKLIFNFGSNRAYKNVEGVLRSFAGLCQELEEVYLIRTDPMTKDQQDLARSLGVEEKVVLVKKENDDDLVGLFNLCDVLVSPSLKEGFGLTVLEAMACGLPVVVSKDTSLAEITGDCGILVDPLNPKEICQATLQVLNNPGSIDRQKLVERASGFTWEKTVQKIVEIYQRVLLD